METRTNTQTTESESKPLDPQAARAMEILIGALVDHYRRQKAGQPIPAA